MTSTRGRRLPQLATIVTMVASCSSHLGSQSTITRHIATKTKYQYDWANYQYEELSLRKAANLGRNNHTRITARLFVGNILTNSKYYYIDPSK